MHEDELKNALEDINNIDEYTCERICRNVAFAFKLKMCCFYESYDWCEIVYKNFTLGFVDKRYHRDDLFKRLLIKTIETVMYMKSSSFCIDGFKTFHFNVHEALVDLDLNCREQKSRT
jgi:hypothetical protein